MNTGTNRQRRSIFMPLMATNTNSSVSPKVVVGKQDVSDQETKRYLRRGN
ncbi:hypothetical protein ACNKHP_00655 [Shigella boydii]